MFDYKKSKFWNDYMATLEDEVDAGLGEFCEYLSQRLEAVEQSVQADLACTCGSKSFYNKNDTRFCVRCDAVQPSR